MSVQTFIFPADVDSAVTEPECEKLHDLAAGKVCLELGSWHGRSAISMGQSAERVHCVDHFLGDDHAGFGATLTQFFQNIRRYGLNSRIVTHVGTFEDVLQKFAEHGFDLVFCDGLHTEEATDLQLQWAADLVEPDGVLAFHDYSDERKYADAGFRVKQVVDEYAKCLDLDVELTDTLAVLRVP